MERHQGARGASAQLGGGGDGQTLQNPVGECVYLGTAGSLPVGDPALAAGSAEGNRRGWPFSLFGRWSPS